MESRIGRAADIVADTGQGGFRDERTDIVQHHALNWRAGRGGGQHAANAAERGADPVHRAVDEGQQMGESLHVAGRLIQAGIGQPGRSAAAGQIRTDQVETVG